MGPDDVCVCGALAVLSATSLGAFYLLVKDRCRARPPAAPPPAPARSAPPPPRPRSAPPAWRPDHDPIDPALPALGAAAWSGPSHEDTPPTINVPPDLRFAKPTRQYDPDAVTQPMHRAVPPPPAEPGPATTIRATHDEMAKALDEDARRSDLPRPMPPRPAPPPSTYVPFAPRKKGPPP